MRENEIPWEVESATSGNGLSSQLGPNPEDAGKDIYQPAATAKVKESSYLELLVKWKKMESEEAKLRAEFARLDEMTYEQIIATPPNNEKQE